MLGVGVMLCEIAKAGRKGEPLKTGQKIRSIAIVDNALMLAFEGGTGFRFYDDGQSCCEARYMRSDDKPEEFVGAEFRGAELAGAPSIDDQYGEHEVQFLRILTDRGVFVASNHNEHNGYYGGFCVHVDETKE